MTCDRLSSRVRDKSFEAACNHGPLERNEGMTCNQLSSRARDKLFEAACNHGLKSSFAGLNSGCSNLVYSTWWVQAARVGGASGLHRVEAALM